MVMKDTYGFSSKAKAREKSKEFIGDHYSESDRKNLSVLTLLGHEPYELEQIWDPLGVPRKNITVVESLPKAYKILQNANYGVNLQPRQEISDFLAETEDAFDVINLDYQGYMTLKRLRNIEEISYRNLLEDRGTLLHWLSGNREKKHFQDIHLVTGPYFLENFKDIANHPQAQANSEIKRKINERTDKIQGLFESNFREDTPELIVDSMAKGILYEQLHPLILSLSSEEKYHNFLKKEDSFQDIGKALLKLIQEPKNKRNPMKDPILERMLESFTTLRERALNGEKPTLEEFREYANLMGGGFQEKYISPLIKWKLQSALESASPIHAKDNLFLETLSQAIFRSYVEGYLFNDGEKFKYINDKGTPMFLDIIQFKKDEKNPIEYKINDKKILLKVGELYSNNMFKKLRSFLENENGSVLDYFAKPRILLKGDPETKQVTLPVSQEVKELPATSVQETKELSKDEIYGLLKQGKTKQEILEIDPSLNPRTISAYQAHVTMDNQGIKKGRPRNKKQKSSKLEKEVLTSDIPLEKAKESEKEELSKEEAVFLLKEGCSTKEILKTYPGAFTDYQLRGYKAAISRGAL